MAYRDETASHLVCDSSVGTSDPDEKKYALGDVDRDGDTDVVCVRKKAWTTPGGRRNVLFLNEGRKEGHAIDGVLVDRTYELARNAVDGGLGLLDETIDRDVILVDVDSDGWLDIVTAATLSDGASKTLSHPRVYRNLGLILDRWAGFMYEPDRIPTLMSSKGQSGAPRFGVVVSGDVTGDGLPELYFGEDGSGPGPFVSFNSRLLINDGRGYFSDSGTSILGEDQLASRRCASACIVDMTGDNELELVRSESGEVDPGVHIETMAPSTTRNFGNSFSVYHRAPLEMFCGDLNRDGRTDIVVADSGPDRYLLNRGTGAGGRLFFSSHLFSSPRGVEVGARGSSVIVDLDDDGWNDVLITDVDAEYSGCGGRLHIYRNLGNPPEVTLQEQEAVAWTPHGVHDVAVFDINGDGRKDLLIGTCRGTSVWMAETRTVPRFTFPDGIPGYLKPGLPHGFRIRVVEEQGMASSGVQLYLSLNGSSFVTLPTTLLSLGLYFAVFPPAPCGAQIRWYLKGTTITQVDFFDPSDAPQQANAAVAAAGAELLYFDDAAVELPGWTVTEEDVTFGGWERVTPIGTRDPVTGRDIAPGGDFTRGPGGQAFVTGNGLSGGTPGTSDLDGGPVSLTSPSLNLLGTDAFVSYGYWFYCNQETGPQADALKVDVSNDDGQSWVSVRTYLGSTNGWAVDSFRVGQYVHPTDSVRVRFITSDLTNNSITEAAIDDFQVVAWICEKALGTIMDSDPPTNAIDARVPSLAGEVAVSGWSSMVLSFDPPAYRPMTGEFAITSKGSSEAGPKVWKTTLENPGLSRVWLTKPLEPGQQMTLYHENSLTFVNLGYLPGDVDGNAVSDHADILALLRQISGFDTPRPIWSVDINRSGQVNALDVPVLIDLLNGAGSYDPWLGRDLSMGKKD